MKIETEADLEMSPRWPTKLLKSDLILEDDEGDEYESDYDAPPPASLGKRKRNAPAPLSNEYVGDTDDDDAFDGQQIPGAKTPKKGNKKRKTTAAEADTDGTQESPLMRRKSTGGRGGPAKTKKAPAKPHANDFEAGQNVRTSVRTRKGAGEANRK